MKRILRSILSERMRGTSSRRAFFLYHRATRKSSNYDIICGYEIPLIAARPVSRSLDWRREKKSSGSHANERPLPSWNKLEESRLHGPGLFAFNPGARIVSQSVNNSSDRGRILEHIRAEDLDRLIGPIAYGI